MIFKCMFNNTLKFKGNHNKVIRNKGDLIQVIIIKSVVVFY